MYVVIAANVLYAISRVPTIPSGKELVGRIQQARKIDSLGNLAGGIAHDFNNILFPIIGMSEMLLEDLSPESPGYENAWEILIAGQRGAGLVKQILAFSRQTKHTGAIKRVLDNTHHRAS